MGWESALNEFRRQQREGKLEYAPPSSRVLRQLVRLVLLGTTHRCWILTYYTYLGLSLLCFGLGSAAASWRELASYATSGVAGMLIGLSLSMSRTSVKVGAAGVAAALFLAEWIGLGLALRASQTLLTLSAAVIFASGAFNMVVIWRLEYGHHSHEANHSYWTRILGYRATQPAAATAEAAC
jgi:hypothetical protein